MSNLLTSTLAKLRSPSFGSSLQTSDSGRAWSTLLGAILLHAVIGAGQLGNILTYMTAYLRLHVSAEVTYSKDMWFTSVTVLAFTLFTIVGGYAQRKLALKWVLFIGVVAIAASNYATAAALDHSFMAVVWTIGFLQSAGAGMIYSNVIVISIKWFPRRRGVISGLIIALDSVATMATMIVQTEYVNPDNVQAVDDYIIDTVVLGRVPVYFRYASLLFMVVGTAGVLLTFMPPPGAVVPSQAAAVAPETTIASSSSSTANYGSFESDRQRLITNHSSGSSSDFVDGSGEEEEDRLNVEGVYKAAGHLKEVFESDILGVLKDELDRDDEEEESGVLHSGGGSSNSGVSRRGGGGGDHQEMQRTSSVDGGNGGPEGAAAAGELQPPKKSYYGVRKALKTRMALILFITFGLSTESSYFIGIMAKPFGQFIKDDKFLAAIISVGNFANCIGGLICGRIMDRIKFKHTMLLVNCIVAASYFSLIFCQYWQSKALYATWIILINFTSIGFFTSHLPEVINKFGDKYASIIYGFLHLGPVISALIFSQFLEGLIQSFSTVPVLAMGQIHYGYYYSFLVIGGLNFFSMIVLMIFYRTRTVI